MISGAPYGRGVLLIGFFRHRSPLTVHIAHAQQGTKEKKKY